MRGRIAWLFAAVCLLAACNGSDEPDAKSSKPADVAAVAREASAALEAEGSARTAVVTEVELEQGGSNRLVADGMIDYAGGRSRTVFMLPDGPLEVVIDDSTVYMLAPNNPFVDDDSTWLELQAEGIVDDPQDAIALIAGTDPSAILDAFATAKKVDRRGEDDVRDTATTHVETTLGRAAMLKLYAANQREQIERMIETGREVTVVLGLWYDSDALPRRVSATNTVEGVLTATTTLDLYDFGVVSDIEIPAGASVGRTRRVVDELELLRTAQDIGAAATGSTTTTAAG